MKQNKSDTGTVVMFDTENSIILGDYLDLLLNRTMDSKDDYSGSGMEGVYVRYWNDRPIQNTLSKLGKYEYISYAKDNERLEKGQAEEPDFVYSGGIRLPRYQGTEKTDEGSGNIVISGKPGVGKSTMAFQFAAACASGLNEGIAVYFSLDVDEKQIIKSMKHSNGSLKINYLCDYPTVRKDALLQYDTGSNKELAEVFRDVLYKDRDNRAVPQIILPKLSPRGISPDAGTQGDSVFLQRIEELQKLLRAISAYNNQERMKDRKEKSALVKLVVIDSLDVFGERTLTREEINRLFMLFKQYGIIGVFTMGSIGYESLTSEAAYKASVTYQADMVIELKREFYNNYTCSYFEVAKSRYIRHVLGHHPYKVETYSISSEKNGQDVFSFKNTDLIKKIVVLPSLHYRISASENSISPHSPEPLEAGRNKETMEGECRNNGKGRNNDKKEWKRTIFGIEEMLDIMPNHFKERSMDLPQIITISGSSGLFKSDIALNALLAGIVDYGQENKNGQQEKEQRGLIVRLGDRDAFAVRGVRFEEKLLKRTKERIGRQDECSIRLYEKGEDIVHNDEPNKYTLKGWSLRKGKENPPQLLEVTFKNGALLPEEFVDEICKIINLYGIKRVVFTDLKYIGSSYPFLVNSDTSGNLFLSAFIHIMRNYGMHVIMSSSESGLEESDVELKKAGILADAILTCTAQVKDGRYEDVYITGEGMITEKRGKQAVVRIGAGKEATAGEKNGKAADKEEAAAGKQDGKAADKSEGTYELLFCDDSDDGKNEIHGRVELSPFRIEFLDAASDSKSEKQEMKLEGNMEGNTDVLQK